MEQGRCTAIVLAAGQGKRMHSKIQKQFLEIGGKPVLYYSLHCFQESPLIQDIILAVSYTHLDVYKRQGIHINAVALWIVFCKYCSHRNLSLLIVESIIRYKNQKHFNQFTMSHLFCVIMCYIIFLPLSEFVNSYGKI